MPEPVELTGERAELLQLHEAVETLITTAHESLKSKHKNTLRLIVTVDKCRIMSAQLTQDTTFLVDAKVERGLNTKS